MHQDNDYGRCREDVMEAIQSHQQLAKKLLEAQQRPGVSSGEWVEELTTALWKLEDLRNKAQKARGNLDEYRAFEEILDLIQNALKQNRGSSTGGSEARHE